MQSYTCTMSISYRYSTVCSVPNLSKYTYLAKRMKTSRVYDNKYLVSQIVYTVYDQRYPETKKVIPFIWRFNLCPERIHLWEFNIWRPNFRNLELSGDNKTTKPTRERGLIGNLDEFTKRWYRNDIYFFDV